MSVEITTLANGFRVASERMPSLASATVGVWIEAGTRHEEEAESGIAHFLEHMAFKGTARRSAQAIAEEIEDVGGYLNAYTSRERTAYYARVLGEDVPLAVDLLADILRHAALAPAEIEVERGVILQEIAQALDTPDDIIFDWLQETAFPAQPMGRAVLGPAEGIRRIGRDDLARFIAGHYRPERMILAAAGAVDHDRLVRLAEEGFGDMEPAGRAAPEPARFAGGERREPKALEQAHFALALASPGYREPDYYAAQVASTALGGGMSSRLFQEARERRGLCYSIFAQCSAWDDSGMLTIYAGTGRDELGGLIDLTADEMRRAGDDFTEAEVARARAQVKAGLVMGLESPSARADRMAAMLSIWGRVPPVEETVARVEAVGRGEARAAAARFAASPPALALVGPVEGAGSLERLAGRLAA